MLSLSDYASMAWMMFASVVLWVAVIAVAAFAMMELLNGKETGALDTL